MNQPPLETVVATTLVPTLEAIFLQEMECHMSTSG